ncbi:hypothetical protein V1509DRAFT_642788 [Lipomyces kononenkoae]
MSTSDKPIRNLPEQASEADDEPDEWDKRIEDSGCASENMSLTNCYADHGRDWRKCAKEIRNGDSKITYGTSFIFIYLRKLF